MSDYAPPSGPPPPRAPEVPSGWTARWNDQYKEWFYVNVYTKKSQWDKPTSPVYPDGKGSPSDSPPGYDGRNAPYSSDAKKNPYGDPSNNFGAGSSSRQSQQADDARLAAKLQAEEDARARGGSQPPGYGYGGGAADSYRQQSTSPYPPPQSSPFSAPQPQQQSEQRGLLGKLAGKLGGSSSGSRIGGTSPGGFPGAPGAGPYAGYGQPPQQGYGAPGYGGPSPGYGGTPGAYGGGYAPGPGYGAPPQGYGQPASYGGGGYQQVQQQAEPAKKSSGFGSKAALGLGGAALGLGAGVVGGLLVEDAIDHFEHEGYDQGYNNGYDNGYDNGNDGGYDGGGGDW